MQVEQLFSKNNTQWNTQELELIDFLSKKITSTKLDQNILGITFDSLITESSRNHKITLDLKFKGIKWAICYNKYISPELSEKLVETKCTSTSEYVISGGLTRDKFVINLTNKN